jgi:hypothetical protein
MSCVLRVSGAELSIDKLLRNISLPPDNVYRKGELKFPASKPNDKRHVDSGASFLVSDAGFKELRIQIEDAVLFLENHQKEIEQMRRHAGVEGISLDFGIESREVMGQFEQFPAKLLRLAGNLDVDLEISLYKIEE